MAYPSGQSSPAAAVWRLVERQHGVISHGQLVAAGIHPQTVKRRARSGRLHRVLPGVYAVGRPQLTRPGQLMAAVLWCGAGAALSDATAAELWGMGADRRLRSLSGRAQIHVSVPGRSRRRAPGIVVHRRALAPHDLTRRHGFPVTTPARTLIDLARTIDAGSLEAAVNEADRLDLLSPERLLEELRRRPGVAGVPALRDLLDSRTFRLTDSELERRFLGLLRKAGLPMPLTRQRVNGFVVDFHWPEAGLIVETDGLRYHRTAAQQARDRERDNAHALAGCTPLRFTYSQVVRSPGEVAATVAAALAGSRRRPASEGAPAE